jgi:hypothetical protein
VGDVDVAGVRDRQFAVDAGLRCVGPAITGTIVGLVAAVILLVGHRATLGGQSVSSLILAVFSSGQQVEGRSEPATKRLTAAWHLTILGIHTLERRNHKNHNVCDIDGKA